MDFTVRKAYACPICGESFIKWGLCLSHLHASEPCRSALGEDTLRNVEQLQEMCRAAASGEAAAKQDATVGTTVSPDNSTPEAPVTEVALSTYEPVDGVEASTFEPQGHTSFEMAGMPANYDNMSGVQTTNFNNMTGVTGPTFDTMNANNMTGVTGPNFDGINGNTMTGVAGPTFDSMNSNTMNAVTGPNFDTMNGVAGPNFDAINGVMPSAFEGMNGVAPNFDASNFDAMNGMMPANFNMNGMMPSSFDAMGGVPSAFDAMGAVAQGFDGMMVPQMNQMNVQMNNQMNAQMNAQLNAQMNAQMNAQLLNAQMNAQMSALQMQALQQQQLAQYSQQEAFGPNPTAPTPTQTETKKDAKPWANYKASSASQSQQHKAPSKAQSQQISNLLKPQPKPVPAPKVTPKAPPKAAPKAGDGLMKELADATPAYTKQKAPPPPPLPQPTADANARGLPALDVRCVARLRRALQCGYLTLMERSTLSEKLEELATYAPSKQLATVKKFLSPSYEDFRWISSKAEWLQRCLNYTRARGENYQYKHKGTKSALVEALEKALADHGLLPFAIDEGCWSTFGLLPPLLQENVTKAVRHGLFLSSTLQPSEHFVHICVNEEVVYNLEAKPVPSDMPAPEQAGMESIDQTLYHQLRQYILFQHRNSEDRCLRLLAESGPILPGTPNSLLYVHMATSDERMKGSAEVLSLLHAASACGLSRLCARFLAEGLPASEATGNELATPLHLAAGRGALESVKVLIRAKADVLKKDINGRTPMYYAVTAAQEDAATPAQESQHQLHLQVCQQLLNGVLRVAREGREWDEEESAELERFAEEKHHWPLLNLLSLNNRLRQLGLRNPAALTDTVIQRISELQYETACLLVSFFEDPPETQDPTECLLKVPDEAMPIELQAILESDFIRDHDRLRRQGNRMHRHFGLSKRCLDVWVSLPYDVAQHALSIFMLEQVSAHHFKVPDDELQAMEAEMADEIQIMNVGEDPNRYVGTIRKWDSERGFGFIVQPQPEEETGEEDHKDIFVHRTNLMGSAPGVHIDLQEGSKVSYFLGMQDGKARALQAAMIDDEFYVHQIHLQKKTSKSKNLSPKEKRQARILEIAEQETHEVSKYFLRQIGSATIQDMVHERRQDFESHFRCWGLLRFNNVKRDDVFWKREIERRVDIFVEQASTPLQKKDFDFRVRRFLTEFCMRRNVIRVSEALAMVSKSISGKKREDIQTWPAYVATLLRKFDPEVNAFITSRESQKNSKADADDTIKDEDAEPEEEDSGSDSEDVGSLSDTLDMYSPPPAQPEQLEEAIPEADEEASGFAFQ